MVQTGVCYTSRTSRFDGHDRPCYHDSGQQYGKIANLSGSATRSQEKICSQHPLNTSYLSISDEPASGYFDEEDIPKDSTTETYAALKLYIDNWRWRGVPFYLDACRFADGVFSLCPTGVPGCVGNHESAGVDQSLSFERKVGDW